LLRSRESVAKVALSSEPYLPLLLPLASHCFDILQWSRTVVPVHVSILHDGGRAQHCYAAPLTQEARTHVDQVDSPGDTEERVLPVPGAQCISLRFSMCKPSVHQRRCNHAIKCMKEFGEESGQANSCILIPQKDEPQHCNTNHRVRR